MKGNLTKIEVRLDVLKASYLFTQHSHNVCVYIYILYIVTFMNMRCA